MVWSKHRYTLTPCTPQNEEKQKICQTHSRICLLGNFTFSAPKIFSPMNIWILWKFYCIHWCYACLLVWVNECFLALAFSNFVPLLSLWRMESSNFLSPFRKCEKKTHKTNTEKRTISKMLFRSKWSTWGNRGPQIKSNPCQNRNFKCNAHKNGIAYISGENFKRSLFLCRSLARSFFFFFFTASLGRLFAHVLCLFAKRNFALNIENMWIICKMECLLKRVHIPWVQITSNSAFEIHIQCFAVPKAHHTFYTWMAFWPRCRRLHL